MSQFALLPDEIRREVGRELLAEIAARANECVALAEARRTYTSDPRIELDRAGNYAVYHTLRSIAALVSEATGAEYEDEAGLVTV